MTDLTSQNRQKPNNPEQKQQPNQKQQGRKNNYRNNNYNRKHSGNRSYNNQNRKPRIAEETIEDIQADIVRIQKEIDLEIKEIIASRISI